MHFKDNPSQLVQDVLEGNLFIGYKKFEALSSRTDEIKTEPAFCKSVACFLTCRLHCHFFHVKHVLVQWKNKV